VPLSRTSHIISSGGLTHPNWRDGVRFHKRRAGVQRRRARYGFHHIVRRGVEISRIDDAAMHRATRNTARCIYSNPNARRERSRSVFGSLRRSRSARFAQPRRRVFAREQPIRQDRCGFFRFTLYTSRAHVKRRCRRR